MLRREAFTIFELTVVLCVVVAITALSLPMLGTSYSDAATASTQASLRAISNAVVAYWSDCKLIKLDGISSVASESTRFQVRWLFRDPRSNTSVNSFNISSAVGWNGPYVLSATGLAAEFGETTIIDAWRNAIMIQDVVPTAILRDVRIVSAGPDGVLSIPSGTATDSLSPSIIGDDLYVALQLH